MTHDPPDDENDDDLDPFVRVLDWLVEHPHGGDGSVEALATASGLRARTLRDWLHGRFPTRRNSRPVEKLDDWARTSVRGYPMDAPGGRTLAQLSGPERRMVVRKPENRSRKPRESAPPPILTDPGSGPHSHRFTPLAGVVVAIVVMVSVLALGLVWAKSHSSDDPVAGPPSPTGAGSPSSTPLPEPLTVPPGPLVRETSDNRAGTPVYADAQGTGLPTGTPQRIRYRTSVDVRCWVPNRTGSTSIKELYLVASGKWRGRLAVSDTFTNGDRLGVPGGHRADRRIPRCPQ